MAKQIQKFLLISIDCWRYDALSRTNPNFNTPKFDLLTQGFSLADRFFVAAPATRPSHVSLFTGLYPFEHGLYGQTYLKMFGGVQNLFQLFEAEGYHVFGRSERSEVFRFLDFESYITARDSQAKSQHLGSLEGIIESLNTPADQPKFSFLHFWYTHGGYGLSGVRNAPNLGAMVKAGQTEEALRYYYAAVTHIQEFLLVEILKLLDLDQWAIFIFGDHGEGFNTEVMAHGDVLHQNVARVPLLANIPDVDQISFPADQPVSMIDLFPTVTYLAGIETDYNGYGQNWLDSSEQTSQQNRWVLTELDSLYGVGFLKASNLEMPHHRVTSRMAVDGEELPRDPNGRRMWSVTDGDVFYRENELSGHWVLRSITDGKDLDCPDPQLYRNHYEDLLIGSNYQRLSMQDSTEEEEQILEDRLRDLGYIE